MITSGQPSLNPRLVKEADALCDAGYEVHVLYVYYNEWATAKDINLLKTKKWRYSRVGGSPTQNKWTYLISKLRFKLANMLAKLIGFHYFLGEFAITRATPYLINAACRYQADLYIAHNLGALPAAVLAAKKNKGRAGFDAEDHHRSETDSPMETFEVQLKILIENKYIPQLDYLSTASPLISKAYQENYPSCHPVTILNVFPKQEIAKTKDNQSALKLFWFSQTIGPKRGLEEIITALSEFNGLELHLLGNYNEQTAADFREMASKSGWNLKNLYFYQPISADELFEFAARFDIGLAAEPSFPTNRDICLTNKIFTYIQAGLAVMASATTAQQDLMQSYPNMGMVYQNHNLDSIRQVIRHYFDHPETLQQHQFFAKKYANEALNWEFEQERFLTLIKATLEKN